MQAIEVGSVWEGRGLTIRVRRSGLAVAIVEILTWSKMPETFRVHPWRTESFEGMRRVR